MSDPANTFTLTVEVNASPDSQYRTIAKVQYWPSEGSQLAHRNEWGFGNTPKEAIDRAMEDMYVYLASGSHPKAPARPGGRR